MLLLQKSRVSFAHPDFQLFTFLPLLKLNTVMWLASANSVNSSDYITFGQMLLPQVHNFLFCANPGSICGDGDYVILHPEVTKMSGTPPSTKHVNKINVCCVELLRFEACLLLQHNRACPYQCKDSFVWLIIF